MPDLSMPDRYIHQRPSRPVTRRADCRATPPGLLEDLRGDLDHTIHEIGRRYGVGRAVVLRLIREHAISRRALRTRRRMTLRATAPDSNGRSPEIAALNRWARGAAVEPPFRWVGAGARYPWERAP